MSWLTELKQEAEAAKARTAIAARASQRVPASVTAVQPQMRALQRFFGELAEQLNVVQPAVRRSYDVFGYARLADLAQTRYACASEGLDSISKVAFGFECVGASPVQFWVDTRDECVSAKERFLKHRLRFRFKDDDKWRYVFSLQADVPVAFEFEPGATGIKLTIKNFERLGAVTYSFDSEKVTEELMTELGKKIVGRPNRFAELSGYQVSSDVRRQFQEKIEARQREREAELKGGAVPAAEPARKRGRLSKLFGKTEVDVPKAAPSPVETSSSPAAPKYNWMVTGRSDGESTSDFVGRIGPEGAARAGVQALIDRGAHFRMCDSAGNVRYTGYILGECTGNEPLEEYGRARGCTCIEYERGGQWGAPSG